VDLAICEAGSEGPGSLVNCDSADASAVTGVKLTTADSQYESLKRLAQRFEINTDGERCVTR
jgi:hypothetical protein